VACVEILERAVGHFFSHSAPPDPNILSFVVMGCAMAISAWISWFEAKKAKVLGSSLLSADSAHTGTDTLSCGAVFAALAGAHFGFAWVDWVASLIVAVIVARAALHIVNQSLNVLSDRVMLKPDQIVAAARSVPGILACHKVRSHGMPGHIHVDLHIQVDPSMTIKQSHALTHQVIAVVKGAISGVDEVFVHTEPAKPEDYH
jgi:cation diffusion facilitator family transporter